MGRKRAPLIETGKMSTHTHTYTYTIRCTMNAPLIIPTCQAGLCAECPVNPQCDTWDDPELWEGNAQFADYLDDSQEKQELLYG